MRYDQWWLPSLCGNTEANLTVASGDAYVQACQRPSRHQVRSTTHPGWVVKCGLQQKSSPSSIPNPDLALRQNPMVESAYLHLWIGDKTIIQQLQHTLRDAATMAPYQDYLQNKFQWPGTSVPHIHWKVIQQLTLQKLSHVDWHIISKFIHKWLPLLDWHHIQSNSINNQFPSCRGTTKTVQHFVNCPHPEWQQTDLANNAWHPVQASPQAASSSILLQCTS